MGGKIQKRKSLLKLAETCKEVEVYSPLNGEVFTDWDNIRPFDMDLSELPATFIGAHRINGQTLEIVWEVNHTDVRDRRGGKRPGSGPKSKYDGAKKKVTMLLLSDVIELLNEESKRTGISRPDIINQVILEKFDIDYEIELKKFGWKTNVVIDDFSTTFVAEKTGETVTVVFNDPCYCAASEEDVCNKAWKQLFNKIEKKKERR